MLVKSGDTSAPHGLYGGSDRLGCSKRIWAVPVRKTRRPGGVAAVLGRGSYVFSGEARVAESGTQAVGRPSPAGEDNGGMAEQSIWMQKVTDDPGHSAWYIERFRSMVRAGEDIVGEARLLDTMMPRGAHVLDAGCGPGRIGGALSEAGHRVVGVDVDPELIAAAEQDHPGPSWFVGDLAELDLATRGVTEPFDGIICAGNVMPFLAPSTRGEVLSRLRAHLKEDGRIAVGFGAGREYDFDSFFQDVAAAGLTTELSLSSWGLRPYSPNSDFLVALLSVTQQAPSLGTLSPAE